MLQLELLPPEVLDPAEPSSTWRNSTVNSINGKEELFATSWAGLGIICAVGAVSKLFLSISCGPEFTDSMVLLARQIESQNP